MASLQPTLRPLSCWKFILRCSWQKFIPTKSLSTYHKSVTFSKIQVPPGQERQPIKKIKVYPPPPSAAQIYKEPIKDLYEAQIKVLDPTGARSHLFSRSNREAAKVGDVLLVRQRNGDPFSGVCINIRRRGVDTAMLLRGQLTRVGVEMWYKIYSPNVEGIEIVQRRPKRARRARLTYMRKEKHDMGSVQNLVLAYQKTKGVLRSGALQDKDGGKRKVTAKGRR